MTTRLIRDYFQTRRRLTPAHIHDLYREYHNLANLAPAAYVLLSTISEEQGVEYRGEITVYYNRERMQCLRCTLSCESPAVAGPVKRSVFSFVLRGTDLTHANCLIVNHKTKVIRQYEPYGTDETIYDEDTGFMFRVMECVENKMNALFGGVYTMQWHTDCALFYPHLGPQQYFDMHGGLCILHSLYRACLDMWNPEVDSEIMDEYTDDLLRLGDYKNILIDVLYTVCWILQRLDQLIGEPKKLHANPDDKNVDPVFVRLLQHVPTNVTDIALEIVMDWNHYDWMHQTILVMTEDERLRLLDRTSNLLVMEALDRAGTTEALEAALTRNLSPTFSKLIATDDEFQLGVILHNPTFRVECDASLVLVVHLHESHLLTTEELTMILDRGPSPEHRCISHDKLASFVPRLPPELHRYFGVDLRPSWLSWLRGGRVPFRQNL